jgi:hypothetical protein
VLQATSSSHSAYMLTSAAARLCHSLGLDQPSDDSKISRAESEQRLNVFWVTYIMDKCICLRDGRPSAINDEDIAVNLPEHEPCLDRLPSDIRNFSTFPSLARLALLESRVHSELYSARSRKKSAAERLVCIGMLDTELQEWKDALPIEVRPGYDIHCDDISFLPVAMMHFSYYNCMAAIHRDVVHHDLWTKVGHLNERNDAVNPRVYSSANICLDAARNVIHVLEDFTQQSFPERINLLWQASPPSAPFSKPARLLYKC